MSSTARIAFLGAGRMGRGMIGNLHKAGHAVTVYNRSPEPLASLADLGVGVAATPAEAVDGAGFVLSMVTGDDASRAVWEGPGGALEGRPAPNAVAIECSTVSHGRIRALAGAASGRGIAFMDCPVAGRPDAAMAGTLTVFAGGPGEVLDRARPVLDAFSCTILHMGPAGSGITFKLVYNAVGATQLAGLAEAMATCRNAGLDMEMAARALGEGATGSAHVRRHSAIMASGDYPQTAPFTPAGRIKDLEYAILLMKNNGVEPGVTDAARALFERIDPHLRNSINDTQVVDFVGPRKPGGSGQRLRPGTGS